uniref:Uncharacterized protein n=1 Tax=Romanomermis culicivorax TaxID=13658 RepID=A0A915KWI0_ROMCU
MECGLQKDGTINVSGEELKKTTQFKFLSHTIDKCPQVLYTWGTSKPLLAEEKAIYEKTKKISLSSIFAHENHQSNEQSRCQNLTDRAQFTFFNYQSATYLQRSAPVSADPYDDDGGYYRKYTPPSYYRGGRSSGRSSSLDRSAMAPAESSRAAALGDDFLIDVEINPDITVNIEKYDDAKA